MAGSRRENRLEVLQHGVRRSAHAAATIWLAESCCHPLPLQGSWRPELCACACLNQANNSLSGFCPDATTGACTVIKQFDLTTRTWYCTAAELKEAGVMPTPSPSPQQQASLAAAASPAATVPTGTGTTGVGTASVGQPTTSPSASADELATIQPLGGARFSFLVQGEVAAFVARAQAVCVVLAALAGEAPTACSIASVTEAAVPTAPAARRLASAGEGCAA